MKYRLTLIALCSLMMSSVIFAKNNRESLDGIVAIVNDTAVTSSEVNTAENTMKSQIQSANAPMPSEKEMRKKILDQVIDRKLQLQAADQAGIKVSDKQVDDTINTIAKENGVSADVLYEKVGTQGLTRSEYRNEIREELTLHQIQQQQVASKVMMKPEDVKNFMRSKEWEKATASSAPAVMEYQVNDLVVLLPENASADDILKAKNQAEALFTKTKQGVNLGNLVKPEDKTLENNDLGWRKLNDIPSAFINSIASAKKGSVLEPIQTGNGFHILQLVDTRVEKNQTQNAMPAPTEKEAQEMVYQRKFSEVLKKWVAKLHSQAVINLHPDSVV